LNSQISAPTLVIAGSEDFICGPLCADELAAGIPGSKKVIVGDAGHMLFVEQPEAFHSEVVDFLDSSPEN
jgi:pimeloyl-ACP methyl ester carboxylesterase